MSLGDDTILYKEGTGTIWKTGWNLSNWWIITATCEKGTGAKATQWDD